MLGKAADISDFDRGQNSTDRRLGTNISEIDRFAGSSCESFLLISYAKWVIDGKNVTRRHGVRRLQVIIEKRHKRLFRLVTRVFI